MVQIDVNIRISLTHNEYQTNNPVITQNRQLDTFAAQRRRIVPAGF